MLYANHTRKKTLSCLILLAFLLCANIPLAKGSTETIVSNNWREEKTIIGLNVYPNPVGDYLNVSINANKENDVVLQICDALGNEVLSLGTKHVAPGDQSFFFTLANKLQAGIYFLKITANDQSIIKRLMFD